MNEKEKYALEWDSSAKFFYENKSYRHLSMLIDKCNTVLEIGCGTGFSTLALLENGHTVIAIERNPYCIEKAKELIKEAGFVLSDSISSIVAGSVFFIECDITDPCFSDEILPSLSIDSVVCWNVGTYWDKEMFSKSLPKMLEYGLTPEQIHENPESSYVELIIWKACAIAKSIGCSIHIVDRSQQRITKMNDPYYSTLKKEFGFKSIKYQNIKSTALSVGGRKLVVDGKLSSQKVLPIVFVSIIMK